ncbi:hypothetical protein BH11ARM2_BH11ARM2_29940 [soil metagenome]
MEQRFYDEEEAKEVLRRATEIQSLNSVRLSHEELVLAAGEMGISEETLARAEADRLEAKHRADYDQEQRRGFYAHLVPYLAVNGFLLIINLLTSPHDPWFVYPALGWGIGLVCHAASVFSKSGRESSYEFWRKKESDPETLKNATF